MRRGRGLIAQVALRQGRGTMQSRFLVGVVAVGLALLVGRTARAPERGIIYGFGLSQMPLGQAVVDFDAVNRLLLVSDIGGTGEDGVRADLGLGDGFELAVITITTPEGFPPEAMLRVDSIAAPPGRAGGLPQNPHAVMLSEINDGQAALMVDPGYFTPLELHVRILHDGVVVDGRAFTPPFPGALVTGNIGTSPDAGLHLGLSTHLTIPGPGVMIPEYVRLHMMVADTMMIAGSHPVDGDEIVVDLVIAGAETADIFIEAVELRAANVEGADLVIDDEALRLFGRGHRSLGDARILGFDPTEGARLAVSNIGSTGADGVSIDFVNLHPVEAAMFDLQLTDKTPGAFLEIGAMGMSIPPDPMMLGHLRATTIVDLAPYVELMPDFTPIGASLHTVLVFHRGELVAEVMHHTGVAANVLSTGIGGVVAAGAHAMNYGTTSPAFDVFFDMPQVISIPGGVAVTGDQVAVIAEFDGSAAVIPVASLTEVSLRASDLPPFTITGETVVAACPWDCGDGNGDVGIVDFLTMLAQWGQVGTSCDFDGGGVSVTDFLVLLANWGACP
jgi:hypothetical protein